MGKLFLALVTGLALGLGALNAQADISLRLLSTCACDDGQVNFFTPTPVLVAPDATITLNFGDTNLTNLTVTLRKFCTDPDYLTLNAAATTAASTASLTVDYHVDPITEDRILNISGTASNDVYQTILRGVLYHNDVSSPDTNTRTITVDAGNAATTAIQHQISVYFAVGGTPTGADASFTMLEDVIDFPVFFNGGVDGFVFNDPDGIESCGILLVTAPAAGRLINHHGGATYHASDIVPDYTQLVFVPADDGNGTPYTTFTYKVRNKLGALSTATYTMTINVTPLNDSPRISNNVYVQIDSGPQTISNLVSVGPADEQLTQVFTDIAVDTYDHTNLFTVGPSFDTNGVLTFTPAPGMTGLSHVVFHAVDDGIDDHCNGEYNRLDAVFTIEVMTVPIRPGDLIVADRGPYLGTGTILVLSSNDTTPGTYTQRILTTALKDPYGIALDTNGDILVADYQRGRGAGGGGLFKLDRYTLAQTTVSIGGNFVTPFGVAVDHYDGATYVADADANDLAGAVYRIDPSDGTQTEVATGFYWLRGIAVDDYDGSVFLTDVGSATPGSETLYVMDPITYALVPFSTGQHFQHPDGMAINTQSGAVYVAEALGKSILAADCGCDVAANQTVISTGLPAAGGSLFRLPTHVAYDNFSGNLFVTDAVASDPLPAAGERRLIQIDPVTGLATQLSSGGYFEQPRGIIVVPPSNFPSL